MRVLDLHGRKIATVIDTFEFPGLVGYGWGGSTDQGKRAASGLYIAVLEVDGRVTSRKFSVMR
jgi:hypothetical protein